MISTIVSFLAFRWAGSYIFGRLETSQMLSYISVYAFYRKSATTCLSNSSIRYFNLNWCPINFQFKSELPLSYSSNVSKEVAVKESPNMTGRID